MEKMKFGSKEFWAWFVLLILSLGLLIAGCIFDIIMAVKATTDVACFVSIVLSICCAILFTGSILKTKDCFIYFYYFLRSKTERFREKIKERKREREERANERETTETEK